MSIRLAKSLCLALLVIAHARPADGQSTGTTVSEKHEIIRRILEVTRAAEVMLVAIEAGVPAQRASNPGVPAVFWDRFLERARNERQTLIDSLVPIYEKAFTMEQLTGLLQFYETPVGRHLVAATPDIARESMLAGQRWGMVLGQEIGAQLVREGIIPPPPDAEL